MLSDQIPPRREPNDPSYLEMAGRAAKEAAKIAVSTAVGTAAASVFGTGAYGATAIAFLPIAIIPKEKETMKLLESTIVKTFGAYVILPIIAGGCLYYGSSKGYEYGRSTYNNLTLIFG